MTRRNFFTRFLAAALAAGLLGYSFSHADHKPGHNPGGGGGGNDGGGGGDKTAPYTIVPFSPPDMESSASRVFDLNEQGHAVGSVVVDNASQAVHLDIATGNYTLMAGTSANGVNNFNEIVGEEEDFRAAFWASPTAQPVALPPLFGDTLSRAIDINDAGIVVGWSEDGTDETWAPLAVVWRVVVDADGAVAVDGPEVLGPLPDGFASTAGHINESVDGTAQVTGWSFRATTEAVVWTVELNDDGTLAVPGPPVGLGTLGLQSPSYSRAFAINNFGDVCGVSDQWPFIAAAGDAMQPLPVTSDSTSGRAGDINDFAEVVGVLAIKKRRNSTLGVDHAYLWSGGATIDLATQIDSKSGWERLHHANRINNDGVIAGQGMFDVDHRGFLMIPNPQ